MIEHNTSIIFPAAPLLTVILALIGKIRMFKVHTELDLRLS